MVFCDTILYTLFLLQKSSNFQQKLNNPHAFAIRETFTILSKNGLSESIRECREYDGSQRSFSVLKNDVLERVRISTWTSLPRQMEQNIEHTNTIWCSYGAAQKHYCFVILGTHVIQNITCNPSCHRICGWRTLY